MAGCGVTWIRGRESAAMKGRRYLIEGRLNVERVDGHEVRATCQGDSGELYALGYGPQAWYCNCPALRRCAHLTALMLITRRPA
jgi:hypothetical protein